MRAVYQTAEDGKHLWLKNDDERIEWHFVHQGSDIAIVPQLVIVSPVELPDSEGVWRIKTRLFL